MKGEEERFGLVILLGDDGVLTPEGGHPLHLAARGGVSRASFARRFNEPVGESPIAYPTAWRMTLASELLLEPGATVDSVSRRVGYADPYGFSEAFRRHLGLRPGTHRDLLTAGGKGRGAGRVGDRPLEEDFEDQTS